MTDAGPRRERRRSAAVEPSPEFLDMVEAWRALQDDLTSAAPPPEVVAEVANTLRGISATLRAWTVPEARQVTGRGRLEGTLGGTQTLIPVVRLDEWSDELVRGTVTFGRLHTGGNGAVHGGAIPLLFDNVLGRLVNSGDRPVSRTAYLHVDYRSITPVGAPLRVEARLQGAEGRKRYASGTLHHGDTLCAEARGLFVALLPHQP